MTSALWRSQLKKQMCHYFSGFTYLYWCMDYLNSMFYQNGFNFGSNRKNMPNICQCPWTHPISKNTSGSVHRWANSLCYCSHNSCSFFNATINFPKSNCISEGVLNTIRTWNGSGIRKKLQDVDVVGNSVISVSVFPIVTVNVFYATSRVTVSLWLIEIL